MLKNVGGIDRILRIVAGLALMALAATGQVGSWGWVGIVVLATGLFSFCGAYTLFGSALGLTAITDNAALTYLGSLIEGLSDEAKYNLMAGAVAGGGLTVIANAPNPAGAALLKKGFQNASISALGLLGGALLPTLIAAMALKFLPQ